jgi:peptidoglycan/LPS O-acetylase OafA/YrhL
MSHSYWRVGTLNLVLLAQELTVGQIEFNNADVINGPAWYLFSLMFTYVVIYFTSLLYKKTKTRLCYLIPLFMGLGMWYSKQNYVFSGEGLARGLVSFTIGIYLGFLLKPYDAYLNKNKYKNRIIIKSIILVELVVAITLLCIKQKDVFIDNLKPYFLIYIFPSVILLLYDFKYINKFNEFKIVQFITNSSYSIYLFDFPILLLTHIIIYQNNAEIVLKWYALLIIIIIHIIIGMISYILIEDKLGNFLNDKFENYYHNKITNKIE